MARTERSERKAALAQVLGGLALAVQAVLLTLTLLDERARTIALRVAGDGILLVVAGCAVFLALVAVLLLARALLVRPRPRGVR
ncbi:hypothetical protein [Cellulosimicrobium funkei]|uniref:hypothetical protein n=1 Tax=Cellulosimicrobium funkei TaxID=264251 RepID=UPI0008921A42|nr:hypothetical protein [Sphaerisporangium cinnabarinum]SDF48048.1 hypothetical protein SAMN04487781_1516 [Cellulosimicrobium cellulans]